MKNLEMAEMHYGGNENNRYRYMNIKTVKRNG